MRIASLLAAVILPASVLAQGAPRLELAGGVANPVSRGLAYHGSGPAARLTVATRPAARLGLRADLTYSAPQLSPDATVVSIGRATFGLEIGYAVYGPLRRTDLMPITLAIGF